MGLEPYHGLAGILNKKARRIASLSEIFVMFF